MLYLKMNCLRFKMINTVCYSKSFGYIETLQVLHDNALESIVSDTNHKLQTGTFGMYSCFRLLFVVDVKIVSTPNEKGNYNDDANNYPNNCACS